MSKLLYVFGAGGHGRELAWLARESGRNDIEIVHLVDDDKYLSGSINGNSVRMFHDEEFGEHSSFVVGIGDPRLRRQIAAKFAQTGMSAEVLVHPRAEMSPNIQLGEGAVVSAGSILSDNVSLGRHSHLNLGSTLSHDVQVGDFVTLSPGVHVAGNVRIEDDVFIGIGAIIINGIQGAPLVVGQGAVIAAGACVLQSVEPGSLMAGVPAGRKR